MSGKYKMNIYQSPKKEFGVVPAETRGEREGRRKGPGEEREKEGGGRDQERREPHRCE